MFLLVSCFKHVVWKALTNFEIFSLKNIWFPYLVKIDFVLSVDSAVCQ